MDWTTLSSFWGKSSAEGQAHSVIAHMLDVGAVATVLLRHTKSPIQVPHECLSALTALHDIGKMSPSFQGQWQEAWPQILGPFPNRPLSPSPRHEEVARGLLIGPPWDVGDELVALLGGQAQAPILWAAVTGHHGRPREAATPALPNDVRGSLCAQAMIAAITTVVAVIEAAPLPHLNDADARLLAWWLAGFTTICDWLGSNTEWFPVGAGKGLCATAYWQQHALPAAERAIQEAGLLPAVSVHAPGIETLFPFVESPSPLQKWAAEVVLPDGPSLHIVEDATGAGKTEAALLLAIRLMQAGAGEGIFLALPSMATANAAYDRLASLHPRLFPSGDASLVLSHGRRRDNMRFQASIFSIGQVRDGAEAQCVAWLQDDRRRAFLATMGVGTVDQALMAVLPIRHSMVRLFGLSRRILIIDEAHAYDAYMTEEIRTLLEFHAALGGSAILLSATLPRGVKGRLTEAFARGLGVSPPSPARTEYPLTSRLGREGWVETPCAMRSGLARRVAVERVADEAAAVAAILEASRRGGAVAWIRNTVKDAIRAAALLREAGCDPLLFHARFCMGHRLAIEERVLRDFGKAPSADRAGRVVVATQVLEQSLDVDFDLMVSDLAPVDLLTQRAGRLWRHARGERPVDGPRLLVLSPEPLAAPASDWLGGLAGTAAVYPDPALLWRGARALFDAGCIETPGGVRSLIEAAYDDDTVPAGFERRTLQAEGRDTAARGIAVLSLLRLRDGYGGQLVPSWDDQQTVTRLGEPSIVLRLARLEDGALRPMVEAGERSWALSEVAVPRRMISEVGLSADMERLVTALRTGWGRWEQDISVLPMHSDGGFLWMGSVLRDTLTVSCSYREDVGFHVDERDSDASLSSR